MRGGRQNTIQSWVKHDDDHPNLLPETDDAYTGEQVKYRHKRASATPGYDENGKADLGYYSDPNETFKSNPLFKVDPAFKVLAGYQETADQLRNALDKKVISETAYKQAIQLLNVKIDKAERKINKAFEHTFIDDEGQEEQPELVAVSYPEDELESATLPLAMQAAAISRYENEEF